MTDPRYDPRFQRGWDGQQPAPVPAPVRPAALDEARPADAAASSASSASPAPPEPDAEPPVDATDDEAWSAPRRNPFRIALVVLGVALLAAGGGMTWFLALGQSQGSTPWATMLAQLPYELMPTAVLAGIAAIIAAIAIGRRPR